MTKYIFITGGVVSSLGKGIVAASLGRLLVSRGYKVSIQKFDPYINVDPGTMSPYEHGEVFVTDDGAETDLISISSCLASDTPKVSYKRIGTNRLDIKILYDVDAYNFLNVYIQSTRPSAVDLHCIIGMSSQTITSMGTVTDVSASRTCRSK